MLNNIDVIQQVGSFSTASLHEGAGRIGALPSSIKPLSPSFKICGSALPVMSSQIDNLWLHRAIYAAKPGDILVVSVEGSKEAGYWGEVMAYAAKIIGIAGLVINAGVRDSLQLIDMGFPVFSSGICIRGTDKNLSNHGSIGEPIHIGDVVIHQGDLVVGDADGVVIIPQLSANEVIERTMERDRNEAEIFKRLDNGETTLDIYNLK